MHFSRTGIFPPYNHNPIITPKINMNLEYHIISIQVQISLLFLNDISSDSLFPGHFLGTGFTSSGLKEPEFFL